ncbi:MAG: chemotaxis protein CheD [Planctomycetota bacterium]
MATATFTAPAPPQAVGMAQINAAQKPARLTAVLGSCVGVMMYHPRLHLGVMGHIVLPDSQGRDAPPGKYADTAIPHMLQLLEQRGAKRVGLVTKIAGGACMFGTAGPLQIGEENVKAVLRALDAAGLAVACQDVAGSIGRRVTLCCDTGTVTVECVGRPPRTI